MKNNRHRKKHNRGGSLSLYCDGKPLRDMDNSVPLKKWKIK